MPSILLIDDEPDEALAFLRTIVRDTATPIEVARTGEEGVRTLAAKRPDVVLLDLNLPDLSGLEVYHQLRQIDARCPIIFITASNMTDHAIEAMKQGAFDYLFKPVHLEPLRRVLEQSLELSRLMKEPTLLKGAPPGTPPTDERSNVLMGRSPAMAEVYKAIGRVAGQEVIVLILGESGTGKELVARAIYQHSKRADKPFLAINCAAIPENLLESELFGHERGAFTGADRRRVGKFEQCNGGTLFLDEIGDMALPTQAKMLRVLQEQRFERVGGNETVSTDVRLIAATNRDLKALVNEGRFRPDLYYRLSVFTVNLPSLHERGEEDMHTLVRHYLRHFNRELGKDVREVAPAVMKAFQSYPWPGNIRELQGVLKQALLQTTGSVLVPSFLPEPLRTAAGAGSETASGNDLPALTAYIRDRLKGDPTDLYAEAVRRLEIVLLPMVMAHCNNSQVKAAQVLGINRRTLRNKLRELGLLSARQADEGDEAE
jgi:two-component system nitrogen regulation response regulator GlnG